MDERQAGGEWVVQDVFSSGIPGPGFTIHATLQEARAEADGRRSAAAPFRARYCPDCDGLIGLDGKPLGRNCSRCR